MDETDYVIIIPARKGSKRLPQKNTKRFCGEPLVEWTITVARSINLPVVITTDDEIVAEIAQKHNLVLRSRPEHLADDNASQVDVVLDALEYCNDIGIFCSGIILLQPTSPLRIKEDVVNAYNVMLAENKQSVVSVNVCQEMPFDVVNFSGEPLEKTKGIYYYINGAVYIATAEWLKKQRTFYMPRETAMYIMPKYRSIDIDDEGDWEVAEKIMRGIR